MSSSKILLTYDFPTSNLEKIAPNLKWIHCTAAGVEHLSPFSWASKELIITNSSGVHAKKAGEYGLMSVLMLQNHMPRIITNQKIKNLYLYLVIQLQEKILFLLAQVLWDLQWPNL